MTRKLIAAALLAAPALLWASPAEAGVCKNNWGDVTPGGQSSQSACEAIGGRWENARKVEEPATGRVKSGHEVKEPESGRVRFSARPPEGGSTTAAVQGGEKLPADAQRGDVSPVRFARPVEVAPLPVMPTTPLSLCTPQTVSGAAAIVSKLNELAFCQVATPSCTHGTVKYHTKVIAGAGKGWLNLPGKTLTPVQQKTVFSAAINKAKASAPGELVSSLFFLVGPTQTQIGASARYAYCFGKYGDGGPKD